ncbi:hypothetical protein SADUNF_Sadunf15G0001300 [Salix dunnii]|uniref:Uncharacterized protein n=1 Tax=Salix dunnii TaxID=1413687 RepID=A0A835MKJ1_9ROSI|nr:hypothetical protein SADUNF_Sadunf15G0001300 [Salix dunnii]
MSLKAKNNIELGDPEVPDPQLNQSKPDPFYDFLQRSCGSIGIFEHRQQQQSIAANTKSFQDELGSYNDPPIYNCTGLKHIAEREEQEQILQFLMGLNDTNSTIHGQIRLMQPLPGIRLIDPLLLQEEKK